MLFEAKALEAHQHTLFRHFENEFFSRNLGQNMSKNAHFLESNFCRSARGSAPEPPLASGSWGLRLQAPTSYSHYTVFIRTSKF